MALQDADLLLVNRGGTNYKVTVAQFKQEINPLQGRIQNLVFTSSADSRTAGVVTVPHTLGVIPFISWDMANPFSTSGSSDKAFYIMAATPSSITLNYYFTPPGSDLQPGSLSLLG